MLCVAVTTNVHALRADGVASRLRFTDPVIRETVIRGASRSKTFRDLLTRLAASDLVVYVERAGPSPHTHPPGHIRFVGATPPNRYVLITVRAVRSTDSVVALLGHELQHAVEIADAPWVVDEETYRELYQAIGKASCGAPRWCFDTKAAVKAGYRVLHELRPDGSRTSAGLSLTEQ